ncbi:hypothetical protein [Burkholderia sp. BCC1993]|uniref:hypothetical protein n=1 Tax=Burkholderia sp. BCC1993 TaxID=2817444 RepID=UPI002AB1BC8F|nr:hypothetical protein [Burkholderia sp. BCC1993]
MIVLDTPALISWLSSRGDLCAGTREVIDRSLRAREIAISVISVLDIGQYVHDGRLELSVSTRSWLSELASIDGIRLVAVDTIIAVRAAALSTLLSSHQRLIAATATTLAGVLVTPDTRMRELAYVETIW